MRAEQEDFFFPRFLDTNNAENNDDVKLLIISCLIAKLKCDLILELKSLFMCL